MHDRDAIIVDPMLATGNSAVAAVDRVKESGPRSIRFVCLLTCPEGIRVFHAIPHSTEPAVKVIKLATYKNL